MRIDLEGSFDVSASAPDAYRALTDPRRVAPLLPLFRELRDVTDDTFVVLMDVGVPQVRGTVQAKVRFVERVPGSRAALASNVQHSLGMADSSIVFQLTELPAGSRVDWTCKAAVRGTLASVAAGVLEPLARRNVVAMIEAVRKELGAPDAPVAPREPATTGAAGAPKHDAGGASLWARLGRWLARLFGTEGTKR